MKELRIGELAELFGVRTHVLRHWETMGLLTPAARVNGRRRYLEEHVSRVAVIVRGQEAGLSLAELRDVLRAPDPARRRALLEHHKVRLDAKLADLLASKQVIEHALNCPEADFTRCESFRRAIRGVIERYDPGRSPARSNADCPPGNRLVTRRSGRVGPKRR